MPNVVDAKGWFSLFTRTRYQYGSLETKERKNLTLGANANAERSRYEQEEMPERYSTRAAYQSYIKNQIRPRWADTPMSAVKPMAVEDWLRNLALAPKTKSHVRSQNPSGSRSGTVPLVVAVDPGAVPDNGADRGLFGPPGQRDCCASVAGGPYGAQGTVVLHARGMVVANPTTGRPYHQEEIQKTHFRKAGAAAGISGDIGWHTFRHSYRSWLDETGAPITVQKELMRRASIQTTMNIYGKAMTDSKRQAHSKVVEMVLNSSKSKETVGRNNPAAAIGS
jgi:hypothetical protein